jgi:hypothetical protein
MFKVTDDMNNKNLRYIINGHTYNSPQSFDICSSTYQSNYYVGA